MGNHQFQREQGVDEWMSEVGDMKMGVGEGGGVAGGGNARGEHLAP
jgi:hypothetical protein